MFFWRPSSRGLTHTYVFITNFVYCAAQAAQNQFTKRRIAPSRRAQQKNFSHLTQSLKTPHLEPKKPERGSWLDMHL